MTDTVDVERLQHFVPFDSLSLNHLRLLATQVERLQLPPTRVLFKRGQQTEQAYFLTEGSVDLADASFQIRHFDATDDENYLALDDYDTHSVSAITTANSEVFALPRSLLALINDWVQIGGEAEDENEEETEEESWMDALLASGLFAQIPPTKIQSLFARFEACEVTTGETVIQEGDAGDTFYVIKQGYALVRKQHGNSNKTLACIRPGQFFGEDALISDRPRGASIVMASDGKLMRLGKEDFRSLLQDSVIRHLSEEELEKLQEESDRPCILLDIRPEMDARHDRIPGARNIPLSELRKPQGQLEKSFIYAICGDTGSNAELGAYLLSDAGFEAYVLDRKTQDDDKQEDTGTQSDEKNSAPQTPTPDTAAD